MKKVYIAGPITGVKGAKSIFREIALKLEKEGLDVVNPFDNGLEESALWEEHMKADVKMLMDCDAIFMLDGWLASKGANIEHKLAKELGLEVIYQD